MKRSPDCRAKLDRVNKALRHEEHRLAELAERTNADWEGAVRVAETWQRSYRDAVTSSPAEAGAVVVFGARDGNVYALDPKTGGAVWTHQAGGGVGASPVVAGDAVFVCDYAGNVFRLGRWEGGSTRGNFKNTRPGPDIVE